MVRSAFLFIFFLSVAFVAGAQTDSVPQRADTQRSVQPVPRRRLPPRRIPPRPSVRPDSSAVTRDSALATDSLLRDSTRLVIDTNFVPAPLVVAQRFDSILVSRHPFFQFRNPVRRMESVRVRTGGKEYLFYSVAGLLLFFALLRNVFGRYLQDLFRLFFRSSLKQRQAKEQLMEAYLPSLLLNLLFVLSGALFLNLMLRQFKLGLNYSFWLLLLYCAAGLTLVYFVKFLTLKLCGWIFRVGEATDTYTFIVFTTNKVLGIALLPFILLLAFTSGTVYQVAFSLSLLLVGALFVYRYFLSYTSVQRQVRLGFFHFVLYLCAFEILPLLLINKLLFHFLG
ncbi:MAG: hypothetical protein JWP27_472 [Flaviaesturariibacter sp.]|nr:hypothetical protein [Flaviaesturariibacter sp.]